MIPRFDAHLAQPDPEDATCTTCDLPYQVRSGWAATCEEHTEFWCEAGGN